MQREFEKIFIPIVGIFTLNIRNEWGPSKHLIELFSLQENAITIASRGFTQYGFASFSNVLCYIIANIPGKIPFIHYTRTQWNIYFWLANKHSFVYKRRNYMKSNLIVYKFQSSHYISPILLSLLMEWQDRV